MTEPRTRWPTIPPIVADHFFGDEPTDDDIRAALKAAHATAPKPPPGSLLQAAGTKRAFWPAIDAVYKDDNDADYDLAKTLSLLFESHEWRKHETWDLIFNEVNESVTHWGFKPWPKDKFTEHCREARTWAIEDENKRDEKAKARAWAKRQKLRRDTLREIMGKPGTPGPKPNEDIKTIAITLGVSDQHARRIDASGTTVLAHQRALAEAFPNDPQRRKPAYWGPRGKGRGTFNASFKRTLFDYVMSGADRLDDLGAGLALLESGYDGALVEYHYTDSAKFITAALACGVSPDDTLKIWTAYKRWRNNQE